ncbi:MAG: D-sedoheptulose 7-phosphate isomerase [Candidatus Aenigmatarchaeota archaeon]
MHEEILSEINESMEAKKNMDPEIISKIVDIIVDTYRNNKKVLIFGNGGSAADAQHVAGELVGRFKLERRALACVALSTDTSIMTAYANDYSFDSVFVRQVEALANPGDVAIGISTSGNSKNVVKAIEKAKSIGAVTVGFTGISGGAMKSLCDICFCAPSTNTPRVQECHELAYHIICNLVEKKLFG